MAEPSRKHTKAGTQRAVLHQTGKCEGDRHTRPGDAGALCAVRVKAEDDGGGDLTQHGHEVSDAEDDRKTTDLSMQDEPTYEYLEYCEDDRGVVVRFNFPGADSEGLIFAASDKKNECLITNSVQTSEKIDSPLKVQTVVDFYDLKNTESMLTERSCGSYKSGKYNNGKTGVRDGGDHDEKADDDCDGDLDDNTDNTAAYEDITDDDYRVDDDGDNENDKNDDKHKVTGDDGDDDNAADDDVNYYIDDNATRDDDNAGDDNDACKANIGDSHAYDASEAAGDDITDTNAARNDSKNDNNDANNVSEAGARIESTTNVSIKKDNVDFKHESNGKMHTCDKSTGAVHPSVAITLMAHNSVDEGDEDSSDILPETPTSFRTIISVSKETFATDIAVNEGIYNTEDGIRKAVNEDDMTRNTGDTGDIIENDEKEHRCCCFPFALFRKKRKRTHRTPHTQ